MPVTIASWSRNNHDHHRHVHILVTKLSRKGRLKNPTHLCPNGCHNMWTWCDPERETCERKVWGPLIKISPSQPFYTRSPLGLDKYSSAQMFLRLRIVLTSSLWYRWYIIYAIISNRPGRRKSWGISPWTRRTIWVATSLDKAGQCKACKMSSIFFGYQMARIKNI